MTILKDLQYEVRSKINVFRSKIDTTEQKKLW